MKFNYASEVIQYCENTGARLDHVSLEFEMSKTGKAKEEVLDYLNQVLEVMKGAIDKSTHDFDNKIHGKIIGNDSIKLRKRFEDEKTVCGKTVAKAVAYAIGTMEINASMGKVVACPTAGSCGVLPAVLISTAERFDLTDDDLIGGLLASNIVGTLVAKNATLSGAEGGCQAEVGTASAMAAGAIVHMLGGTPRQVFNAAAICFKNLMGLVCDPIAGLVESPCAKRNGIGTANALICAEMSLAGVESIVPFDEVVEAMFRVGKAIPPSLRETSRGGLAITKTALKINDRLFSTTQLKI